MKSNQSDVRAPADGWFEIKMNLRSAVFWWLRMKCSCRWSWDEARILHLDFLTVPNRWKTKYCSADGLWPTRPSFQLINYRKTKKPTLGWVFWSRKNKKGGSLFVLQWPQKRRNVICDVPRLIAQLLGQVKLRNWAPYTKNAESNIISHLIP